MQTFLEALSYIIPIVIAITMHEAAHGFVAYRCGDPTAKMAHRLTLNPFRHVDLVGTILLPGFLWLARSPILFGYAKPVPVNFKALRRPRRDMLLVAIAGPMTNVVLAFVSALLLHVERFVTPEQAPFLFQGLYISILINAVLAVFNMLPVLPLDGGRVLNALLPPSLAARHAKTERFGMLAVLLLLLVSQMHSGDGPGLFYYLVGVPADFLRTLLMHAAGIGDNAS